MAFRLQGVKTLELKTPESVRQLAAKLKGHGGTECEREDKASRMHMIKTIILKGEATPFRWCVGHVKNSDLWRRVNGQHSSEVFLGFTPEEWAEVRFPIVVIWEEYDCDTINDLAPLFEQFDPQWSLRNSQDIMGAHLGVHDDLRSAVNRHVALIVANGLVWHRRNVEGQKLPKSAKFQVVHENHDTHAFMIWCASFLQKDRPKEIHNPPVMAAIYHTAKDDSARAFWRRVAAGKAGNVDEDSHEYKLATFLDMCQDPEAEWPRSIARHLKGNKPSDKDIFKTCLRTFFAWKTGKKIVDVFTSAKDQNGADIAAEFGKMIQAA